MSREEPVSEPKPDGKSFAISKRLVWEAWRRVKANTGAFSSTHKTTAASGGFTYRPTTS